MPNPPARLPKATARPPAKPVGAAPEGERIAKVLARAGVASRRVAEDMIAEGRVSVNGKIIDSPALNVSPRDRIHVDGKPLAAAEPIRLWLYNKPLGLVTSERDEKGRDTVFDALPEDMPRVMSIGRLDLNSEGLLLLTNDGDLKRRLELPSTGWVRKYRVRVNGSPTDAMLAPLRQGLTIEGERFLPMMVTLDRQQGANAWLTIGLREGKNREIRRAMEAVGLIVNRLIRISYGPFQLGNLPTGAVEEVRPRALRDQLGLGVEQVAAGRAGPAPAAAAGKPGAGKPGADRPGVDRPRAQRPNPVKPRADKPAGGAPAKGPAKAPARRADKTPDDAAQANPARKSWGSRSHGGAKPGEKPRSWGGKSASPTTPRRPEKPR